jgi:TolB-like protein
MYASFLQKFAQIVLLPGLLACLLFAVTPAHGTEPTPGNIVFLPFAITTEKPQQYLRDGLTDILASRVANRTGLTAVHKNSQTKKLVQLMDQGEQQKLKELLESMQAEHLVLGSLKRQKNDFEILVTLFSKNQDLPVTFSKTISTIGQAIPALDDLAGDLTDTILHKKKKIPDAPKPASLAGTSAFQTAHPDRAYKEGLYKPSAVAAASGIASTGDTLREAQTDISEDVRTMASGDLNGDSITDIILIGKGALSVYTEAENSFKKLASYSLPGYLTPHAVNIADFTNNGLQEIYISANSGNRPTSLVLEWDGTAFHTLQDSIPYYLRPGLDTTGKPILIGQKGGTTTPFSPSMYALNWQQGALVEGEKLPVPKGFNLFDFIRIDFIQDGEPEIAALKNNDQLVILSADGNELWASENPFGASKTFLGDVTRDRAGDRTLTPMHARLIARDIDGDTQPELIVSQNLVSTVQYFTEMRFFRGTSISALRWDGSSLGRVWETPLSKNYTVDYQVIPHHGAGNTTRLYTVETENNSPLFFWKTSAATLQYYDMQ